MSRILIQASEFKGMRKQPLHNVLIGTPAIIWVARGEKQLWWHDRTLSFASGDWLLVPANQYLTFVNVPEGGQFHSRMLTLHTPPPSEWLQETVAELGEPRVAVTSQLAYCFDLLWQMPKQNLAESTQSCLLQALYAELRVSGGLRQLFPAGDGAVRARLATYLGVTPGDEHRIDTVAAHFAMSRATLVRRLAAEGTTFRQVLTEVRMGYALGLLQQARSQSEVAVACGYQSAARFSSRFRQQFGLTPRQYAQTLG